MQRKARQARACRGLRSAATVDGAEVAAPRKANHVLRLQAPGVLHLGPHRVREEAASLNERLRSAHCPGREHSAGTKRGRRRQEDEVEERRLCARRRDGSAARPST
jgi:hypothetical protein